MTYFVSLKKTLMAKKRTYNYQHLKSILWKERKEGNLYSYNSPNFNKLVSEVYQATGKKNPKKIIFEVESQARKLEEYIFLDIPSEIEPVAYYDISRQLESFQKEPSLTDFIVKTDFRNNQFPDLKFPLQTYEYQGSHFEDLIKAVDKERKGKVLTNTPPAKFIFKIDKKKKTIFIFLNEAPTEPPIINAKTGKPEKRVQPITKIKTKESIAGQTKKKQSNLEHIKDNERDLKVENKNLLGLIKAKAPSETVLLFAERITEKIKEIKVLKKQNAEIDKYLKDSRGFKVEKTKAKPKAKTKKPKKR